MKHLVLPKLALVLGLLAAMPAQAITFDFFWSGDSAADATLVSSDDDTARAVGTITINKGAGETFVLADVTATSISVTGDLFTDFVFTSWLQVGGTIAADGLSASFSADGNPYSNFGGRTFGCRSASCNEFLGVPNMWITSGTGDKFFDYSSQSAALASMKMTAQMPAVPLPAGGALLVTGLAGLAALRRRRRAA